MAGSWVGSWVRLRLRYIVLFVAGLVISALALRMPLGSPPRPQAQMYARNITRERNPAMAAPLWHPRRARTAVKDDAATPAPSRVARTSSSARPQRANRRPVPTSASLPLPRATREAAVLAEGAVAAARTPSQRGGGAEAVEDAPAPARAEVVALAAKSDSNDVDNETTQKEPTPPPAPSAPPKRQRLDVLGNLLAAEHETAKPFQPDDPPLVRYSDVKAEVAALEAAANAAASPLSMANFVPTVKGPCQVNVALLNYTVNRINEAKLVLTPYPHVYITDIFDPRFYRDCILAKLPPTAAYNKYTNGRHQIHIAGRQGHGPQGMNRLGRPEGKLDRAKARLLDVPFWTDFAKLFASQELTLAWLHKFYPTLRNRDLMERMRNMPKNYFYSMALGRDLRGYSIGPHTDTADKWVTTLYYLPRNNKHPNLGTAVVRSPTNQQARGNYRGKLDGKNFVVAKKSPFVPNAVHAFAACTSSWHAVQYVSGVFQRDTIQGFVSGPHSTGKRTCGKPGDPLEPDRGW